MIYSSHFGCIIYYNISLCVYVSQKHAHESRIDLLRKLTMFVWFKIFIMLVCSMLCLGGYELYLCDKHLIVMSYHGYYKCMHLLLNYLCLRGTTPADRATRTNYGYYEVQA